jgi:hypothetical protein
MKLDKEKDQCTVLGKKPGEHSKGNKTVPEKVATTRTEMDTNGIPNQALQYRSNNEGT